MLINIHVLLGRTTTMNPRFCRNQSKIKANAVFFLRALIYIFFVFISHSHKLMSSYLISSPCHFISIIPTVARNTTRKDMVSQKRKEHLKDLPVEISKERVIMLKGTYVSDDNDERRKSFKKICATQERMKRME